MLISAFVSYGWPAWSLYLLYALRYLEFGTYTATYCFIGGMLCAVGAELFDPKNEKHQNAHDACVDSGDILFIGDGIKKKNYGMTIKYANNAKLWDTIRKTPEEGRILAHPKEADGVTFWTGRASTVAYERLVPWNTVKWKRNKKRAEEALRALYETDKKRFLAYCEKNNITHVIKKKQRYAKI